MHHKSKIARFSTSYAQALMELKGFPEEDLYETEVLERARTDRSRTK